MFHRVLESRILDFHRRTKVRRRWRVWLGRGNEGEDGLDPLAQVPDPEIPVISLTDLGIIRDVAWQDDTLVVTVTPTNPEADTRKVALPGSVSSSSAAAKVTYCS